MPADTDGVYYLLIEPGNAGSGYAGPVGRYAGTVQTDSPIPQPRLIHDNWPDGFRRK